MACVCLPFFISVVLFGKAAQATSQTVRVDGNVYTAAGAPVTGTRDIVVKAYGASTGGSALWTSSTFTNTAVTKGRFSVSLDASSGLTQAWSDASGSLWFEITVGSDIVRPRIQAKGAMFAVAAATADKIRNRDVSTLAPATGDVLTWTGSAWAPAAGGGAAGSYVAKAGDTMTGKLTLGGATNNIYRLYVPWLAGDTNSSTYFGSASSSNDQTAVLADSYTGNAVYGHSVAGSGVWGKGDSGVGVRGASDTSLSGLFQSNSGSNTAATLVTRRASTASGDLFQAQDSVSVAVFSIGASGAVKATSLTASRLVRTDASQILTSVTANPTDAELGYLSGVTAPIQTQINSVVSGGSFVAKSGDTMSGSLKLPAGTSGTPALIFPGTAGVYSTGGNTLAFKAGAQEMTFNSSGNLYAGTHLASDKGSVTYPAFAFSTDPGTGVYSASDGQIALASGGSDRLTINSSGGVTIPALTAGRIVMTDGSKTLSSSSAAVTGTQLGYLASVTSSTLGYLNGVTAALQTQINNVVSGGAFVAKAGDTMTGTLAAPTISATGSLSGATIQSSSLTASKLVLTDGSKNLVSSGTSIGDTELGYLSGATANLQTQINSISGAGSYVAKAGDTMTGTLQAPTVNVSGLTASKLIFTDGSKNLSSATSAVTDTQLGYLVGVTAPIQTQINSAVTGAGFVAKGGDTMTGALMIPVGSLGAPSLQLGDVSAGIFSDANNLKLVKGGVASFSVLSYGVDVAGALTLGGAGSRIKDTSSWATNAAPFISSSDDKSGLYFPGASSRGLVLVTASTDRLRVTSGGAFEFPGMTADRALYLNASTQLTTSSVTSAQLGYLASVTSSTLGYLNGVTGGIQSQLNALSSGGSYVAKAGDTMGGRLGAYPDNGSGSPGIYFTGDTDTGFAHLSADTVALVAANAAIVTANANGAIVNGQLQGAAAAGSNGGTATSPAYTFYNDPDTGVYSPAANGINITAGGVDRIAITSGKANFTVPVTTTITGVTTTTADFAATNLVTSTATCGSVTLSNLQTGGAYSLIMTSPGTGTCSFTASGRTVTAPTIPAATSTAMVFSFLVTSGVVYVNYTKY